MPAAASLDSLLLPPAEAASCARITDASTGRLSASSSYFGYRNVIVLTYSAPVDLRFDAIRVSTSGTESRAHCSSGDNRAACYSMRAHDRICYVSGELSNAPGASCSDLPANSPIRGGHEIRAILAADRTHDVVVLGPNMVRWDRDGYYTGTGYRSEGDFTGGTTGTFTAARTGGACFTNGAFTLADVRSPTLDRTLAPTLDLSAGHFTFRSTEPLSGTAKPGGIAIAGGCGALDSGSSVSITRGTDVRVTLTPAEHDCLDTHFPSATYTTFKTWDTGLADYSGNPFSTGRYWQGITIVRDTNPPVLRGQHLDFNTGVLTLTFDEDVHSLTASRVYIEDRHGGNRHSLASATVPRNLHTTTVQLTLPDGLLETLGGVHRSNKYIVTSSHVSSSLQTITTYTEHSGLRIDVLRGAAADVARNSFLGVHDRELGVTGDNVAPRIASGSTPSLDMAHHRLTLAFDEKIDVSETNTAKIRVVNRTGDSVSLDGRSAGSRDAKSVTVSLGNIHKAEIADLGAPLTVSLEAGAFKDVWGNGNAATSGIAASVGRDWIRPGVHGGRSSLDLGTGTLEVGFNDAVYVDRIYTRGYALQVADPSTPQQRTEVGLRGAEVATTAKFADLVTLRLTDGQKAAVVRAGGASPDVKLTVGGWAFSDYPAANHGWYLPRPGWGIPVTSDRTAPEMADGTDPVLDSAGGTISIRFDEYVDSSAFNPSGLAATTNNGTSISLAGASASAGWSGSLAVLDLPATAAAEARQAYHDEGHILLTVPNTAFADLSGNRFRGVTGAEVTAATETGPLQVVRGPSLDLNSGILEMGFNRGVSEPAALAGISIGGNGTAPVALAGAGINLTGTPPTNLTISLTAAQKADAAAALSAGGRLTVSVSPTSLTDAHHRSFAGLQNAALETVPDTTPPTLESGPTLDATAGTVSMSFDEYVEVGTADPAQMWVYNMAAGGNVSLAGASVSAQGSGGGGGAARDTGIVVTMTPFQRALVLVAMHSDPTMYVRVSGSAVYDVSGIPFGGEDTGASSGPNGTSPSDGRAAAAAVSAGFDPAPPSPRSAPADLKGADGAAALLAPVKPGVPGQGQGGNVYAQSSPPSVQIDVASVHLDLNTGVLEVELRNPQWAQLPLTNLTGVVIRGNDVTVPLDGAAISTAHGYGTGPLRFHGTIIINLTAAQKAAAAEVGTAPKLIAPTGTFVQPITLAPYTNVDANIVIKPDATAPMPARPDAGGNRTVLDLGEGRLDIVYDEYVSAPLGGLDAGLITVEAGSERIRLEGAQGIDAVNDTVTVALTQGQKAVLVAATAAASNAGEAVTIDVAPGAAADVSGNAAPGAAGVALAVFQDGTAPALAATPVLNLGTGTLALEFDEYIAMQGVRPQEITIEDRNGGGRQSPSSSVASEGDGVRVLLLFTDAQTASLRASNETAGPLRFASTGAAGIADLTDNAFAGLAGANLSVINDSTPPALLPGTIPLLDIGTGTLSMMFTEHIPEGRVDLSGAAIEDVNGASRVPLAGAGILYPSGPEVEYRTVEDDTLRIVLTPDQRAAVAAANSKAGPVRLDAPSSAVSDAAGLRFAGLSNAPLGITLDRTPPEIPPGAVLDMSSGLLEIPFNEHVDAEGANILGVSLTVAGPSNTTAPLRVQLAGGATVVVPSQAGGDFLEVRLSAGQLAAVAAVGIAPAVNLTVAAGAVSDLSGNAFAGLADEPIGIRLDGSAPALAYPPVIDLDDGTVLITFGEYVNASAANLTGISIEGPGGAGRPGDQHAGPATVRLEGAGVSAWPPVPGQPGQASPSILITMTADQKAMAAAAAASNITIVGRTAAIEDLSGNLYGGISGGRALVVPDETGPAPASAALDLGAGTVTVLFDEHVHAESPVVAPAALVVSVVPPVAAEQPPPAAVRVDLAGAPVSASENAVTVWLTGGQRAALQGAVGPAGGAGAAAAAASLDIARGFATDLAGNLVAGNPMAAARGLSATLESDRTPPGLAGASGAANPVLNLAAGTVTLAFDEYIYTQGVRLHDVSIAGPGGENRTSLGGASLAGVSNTDIVTVILTPGQADAARALNASAGGQPVAISAAPGAFPDLAGNPSTGTLLSAKPLAVTGQDAPPEIDGMPVLDLASGTVRITFDRAVDVPASALRGIYVMGADRTGGATSLAGADLLGEQGPAEILIGLTGAQKASIAGSYARTGSDGATIDVSAAAGIADMWRNAFEGLAAEPMNVTRDNVQPRLAGAVVDLSAGTVRLDFDEYVRAGSINPSAVRINASDGSPAIPLAGAPVLAAEDGPSILLGMTPSQKAAAEAAYVRGAVLSILAGPGAAARDLSGNQYPGADGTPVEASVAADAASPSLDARLGDPVLDLGQGVMTISFDEHLAQDRGSGYVLVFPGAPGSAPVQILPPAGGQQGAGLSIESSTASFQLSPDQRARLLAGGAGTVLAAAHAVRLDMEPGAFADLAGNPSSAAPLRPVSVVADTVPPALDPNDPPALDMGSGALRIAFDEHIDVLLSDLAGLSLSVAGSGSGPVALSAAHLEPVVDSASSVTLLLTRDEKGRIGADMAAAAAAAGGSPATEAVLRIAAGAFSDLSGNGIEQSELRIAAAADADPPHLDRLAPPLLHTGASPPSLEFDFDEYVDVSGINASGIVLRGAETGADAGDGSAIRLAGADAYAAQLGPRQEGDGYRVRVPLTDAQASAAGSLLDGGAGRLVVDVKDGAFADLAGNAFAGLGGHGVEASGDADAPILAASPHLNLGRHVLILQFNEPVRLASDGLAGIELSGANGSNRHSLDGALAPSGPSLSLRIELSAAQVDRARSALQADGALAISMSAEAAHDLSYNHFAGLRNAHLGVIPDTEGPVMAETGRDTPSLDLASGLLTVRFSEGVDAARYNLTGAAISLGGDGDPAVGLEGAAVLSGSRAGDGLPSPIVRIAITDSQKSALAGLGAGGLGAGLSLPAGAFYDMDGNAAPAVERAPLAVSPDVAGPSIDSRLAPPVLDLENGVVKVRFDEPVGIYRQADSDDPSASLPSLDVAVFDGSSGGDGRHRVSIGAPSAATMQGSEGSMISISLDPGQRAALADAIDASALLGFGAGAVLVAGDGLVHDLSGNGLAGYAAGAGGTGGIALAVVPDSRPPALDPDRPPVLDMGSGMLTVWFDEYVVPAPGAAAPAALGVSLGTGASLSLAGATVQAPPADGSNEMAVRLTHVQKAQLAAALDAAGPDAQPVLSVAPGAAADLHGNPNAAASVAAVPVRADAQPPRLEAPPILNTAAGSVYFDLDEFVDAGQAGPEGLAFENADGSQSVRLLENDSVRAVPAGAGLPDGYSDRIGVAPASERLADILGYASAGGQAAVRLNVSGAALADLAGNGIASLARVPLTTTDDAAGPALLSASVDLGDGDVVLVFNETVDAAGAVLSQMRLEPVPRAADGSGGISLAGASLLLPHGIEADDRIELQMSGAQKAAAAAAYAAPAPAGSGLALAAPPGAVYDSYGNPADALDANATVDPDTTRPALLEAHSGRDAPHLDLGTGVLTLRFTEHVAAASIEPSGIAVRGTAADGGGSGPPASLAGAVVSQAGDGPYSDSIAVSLSPESKAAAVAAIGARSLAGLLDIAGNASIADPSSNAMLAVSGAPVLVRPDRSPPAIDSSRTYVDLRAGTVSIAFDEYVEGAVDVSGIAVGAQGSTERVTLGPAALVLGAAPSDTVTIRMTDAQAIAVASLVSAASAASAGGGEEDGVPAPAAIYAEPGIVSDLSGNRFAGTPADGLAAGETRPPVTILGASVTAPGAAVVEYSHAVESSPQDYVLDVDGARRTVVDVSGSGSAVHTIAFEPADAPPDATGTVSVGRLSGPGYVFVGTADDGIAALDGQAPGAVSAAAAGASAVQLYFDEAVASVDASGLAVMGVGSQAVEIVGVSGGAGASRLVLVGAPAFAGGASGAIEIAAGALVDPAGNANNASARIDIMPASVSVRAPGAAPVILTADTVVRNVTGEAPRIDLSEVDGAFPPVGDFAITVEGAGSGGGAAAAAVAATVVFPAGTAAVSGLPADSVISFSVASRTVPDRAVIGGGQLGVVVEVGHNGTVVFDRPVRIVLPGAAGSTAFWLDAGGAVSLIGQCAGLSGPVPADGAAAAAAAAAVESSLGGSGECAADSASGDKVIYTYHFTAFGTVAAPVPSGPLPAVGPASQAPPPAVGTCAADPAGCGLAARDASLGTLRLSGPGAAFGGMLYAAGPASNESLGESIYAIDARQGAGQAGGAAAAPAEIELEIFDGIAARVSILDVWAGGQAGGDSAAAPPPPLLVAAATYQTPVQGAAADGSLSPPSPVLLVIDAANNVLASHADLTYEGHSGQFVSDATPALLGAYPSAGAVYVGMQTAAPAAGGPVLLVDVSDPSAPVLVPMYDPDAPSPPSPAGYYYPREGWEPTAMAARGTAVYMVGAAWQQGSAAGDAEPLGLHGLHTLSFAAGGDGAAGAAPAARYSLVSSIESAGPPSAAAGIAIDPVRSKLYVLHGNGTISAYALDSADRTLPPAPSFLYHVDASVPDPRGLALDAGTGLLYAAAGGSVRVYDASADRLVATVPSVAGEGGIQTLVLAAPAEGDAAATVYAMPANSSDPVRIVGVPGDADRGGSGGGVDGGPGEGPAGQAPPPPPVVVVAPAGQGPQGSFFGAGSGGGGGGGGGGSGGGGSGRTGLAVGAGPSLAVSSVSWDCTAGLAQISLGGIPVGAGAPLPDVSILASSGTTVARAVPGAASGQAAAYEADLPEDEVFLVRAIIVDGRDAASVSKTVRTGGQCTGEAVFDAGEPASPDQAAAPSMADAAAADAAAGSTSEPPAAAPGSTDTAKDGGQDMPPADAAAPPPAPPQAVEQEPAAEPEAESEPKTDAAPPVQEQAPAASPPPDPGTDDADGGGCLVATAAYGTELAPQVQALREVRDTAVMSTGAGAALLSAFNTAYYAVSPQVADLERAHPALRDAVRALIAPPLYAAQAISPADPGDVADAVPYAVPYAAAAIAAMAALYVAAPAARGRLAGALGR